MQRIYPKELDPPLVRVSDLAAIYKRMLSIEMKSGDAVRRLLTAAMEEIVDMKERKVLRFKPNPEDLKNFSNALLFMREAASTKEEQNTVDDIRKLLIPDAESISRYLGITIKIRKEGF